MRASCLNHSFSSCSSKTSATCLKTALTATASAHLRPCLAAPLPRAAAAPPAARPPAPRGCAAGAPRAWPAAAPPLHRKTGRSGRFRAVLSSTTPGPCLSQYPHAVTAPPSQAAAGGADPPHERRSPQGHMCSPAKGSLKSAAARRRARCESRAADTRSSSACPGGWGGWVGGGGWKGVGRGGGSRVGEQWGGGKGKKGR